MRYHKRKAQLKSWSFPRNMCLWISPLDPPPFPGGDNLSGECCMCVYEQGWSCIGPLHPYCPYRSTQPWIASLISVPDCPENTRIRKNMRGSGPRICSLFQWHTVYEKKKVMQIKNWMKDEIRKKDDCYGLWIEDELRDKQKIIFKWRFKDYVGSCNRDENIVDCHNIIFDT